MCVCSVQWFHSNDATLLRNFQVFASISRSCNVFITSEENAVRMRDSGVTSFYNGLKIKGIL